MWNRLETENKEPSRESFGQLLKEYDELKLIDVIAKGALYAKYHQFEFRD